jgi:WD40 repeat protein
MDPVEWARTIMPDAVRQSRFACNPRPVRGTSHPARWKYIFPIALALLALAATLIRQQAGAAEHQAALPPRALLRIGTGDLRLRHGFTTDIAFSPDGRLVAASEANCDVPTISLFDVRTGRLVKLVRTPLGAPAWVQCLAFSPDQTRLAWGEIGGEVALWDLAQDRLLFREKLHRAPADDVAFSPDSRLMASAGGDVIHLRRVANPAEPLRDFMTQPGPVPGQPDKPNPALVPIGEQGIGCLSFTPDGTRLVAGSGGDATLFIWYVPDGRLLRTISDAHGDIAARTPNPRLNSVAVTPDGRRIMSVGQTTKPIGQTKLQYGPENVTMSEVRFWDIETGQRIADYRGDDDYGFGYGALSNDGRHVAVGDFGRLRILDAATGLAERTIELPGTWGGRPAFSPDGTLVAVQIDNTIGLFEVATGRRLHHDASTPVGSVVSAAWSPSGDRIVTGHADGFVRVWDATTGKLIWHKLLAPVIGRSGWNARAAFLSFARGGKLVVAAGRRDDPVNYENGIVVKFDAATGLKAPAVPLYEVRWAALAPDGQMVVATSHGSGGDTHFVGIDLMNSQTRWANPPRMFEVHSIPWRACDSIRSRRRSWQP